MVLLKLTIFLFSNKDSAIFLFVLSVRSSEFIWHLGKKKSIFFIKKHSFIFILFIVSYFVIAAIPGNTFPSRNSKEAPPPVEIWLILSARPLLLTALTESPPPIIETASASATP